MKCLASSARVFDDIGQPLNHSAAGCQGNVPAITSRTANFMRDRRLVSCISHTVPKPPRVKAAAHMPRCKPDWMECAPTGLETYRGPDIMSRAGEKPMLALKEVSEVLFDYLKITGVEIGFEIRH